MKKGLMVTLVQCHGCNMTWQVNHVVLSELQVQATASQVHKSGGNLCFNPLLIVGYITVFLSNELVRAVQGKQSPLIHTPNGNGSSKQTEPVQEPQTHSEGDSSGPAVGLES